MYLNVCYGVIISHTSVKTYHYSCALIRVHYMYGRFQSNIHEVLVICLWFSLC